MSTLIHRLMITAAVPMRVALFGLIQSRKGWNSEQIKRYQEAKLQKMIRDCWEHVPFYRDHWRTHIDGPEDIQSIQDLQKLPLLTKAHVRENLTALLSTKPGIKSTEARTGGSTGQPVIFRMTHLDEQLSWAHMYIGWSWAGYTIGDPFLVVGGESVGVGLSDKRSTKDKVMNRWVTSGSNITLERTKALIESPAFDTFTLFYGYPNSIRELCECLLKLNARPKRLKGVVCTAEVMRPEVRERIEHILGVKVLDQYGLNDGGLHACEGPEQDGLHLSFHRGILEVLDESHQQIEEVHRVGRAVATLFSNEAMPFVRYETGDRIHWHSRQPAASGVAWPRIGPVDGRTGDVLHFPGGRKVPMPGLTLVMRWIEGLHSYQFIQTAPNAVTVRLEGGADFAWSEEQVRQYLQQKIGMEVNWTIEWGAPHLTKNGKLLIIRNDWLTQSSDTPIS